MSIRPVSSLFPRTMDALAAGYLLFLVPASAHEPGMSTAYVTAGSGRAEVVLTFSSEEIGMMPLSLSKTRDEKWQGLADGLMTLSGRAPTSSRIDTNGDGDVVYFLFYDDLPAGALLIGSPLLASFVPGHRQYLIVRDAGKHLLLRCFLTPDENSVTVDTDPD